MIDTSRSVLLPYTTIGIFLSRHEYPSLVRALSRAYTGNKKSINEQKNLDAKSLKTCRKCNI